MANRFLCNIITQWKFPVLVFCDDFWVQDNFKQDISCVDTVPYHQIRILLYSRNLYANPILVFTTSKYLKGVFQTLEGLEVECIGVDIKLYGCFCFYYLRHMVPIVLLICNKVLCVMFAQKCWVNLKFFGCWYLGKIKSTYTWSDNVFSFV